MSRISVAMLCMGLCLAGQPKESSAQEIEPLQRRSELKVGQDTNFGNEIHLETGREFVRPRTEEDGYYFTTELKVNGYKDRAVQVSIWSKEDRFLGETRVVPPYDNTRWKALKVFVPFSRLMRVGMPVGYTVYAVPLDEPAKYIARSDVTSSNFGLPKIIWEWHQYRHDAPMDNAQNLGFLAKVSLRVVGVQNSTLKVTNLVRAQRYGNFPGAFGSPIRAASYTLKPQYTDSTYDSLDLKCPYSELVALAPTEVVTLTPAIEIGGVLQEGNVHFRFLAGGSFERVEQITRDQIEKDQEGIKYLQGRVDLLRSPRN